MANSPGTRTDQRIWGGSLLAGAIGFGLAYYIWRIVIGVPLELHPVGGITLDAAASEVRPWAPWWVVPTITAVVAILAWRLLAVRTGRVSLTGGMIAIMVTSVAIFPISFFALELGAIAQYVPLPSLWRIIAILPLIAMEAVAATALNLAFHGIALLPLAALLGLALAGALRLVMPRTATPDHRR